MAGHGKVGRVAQGGDEDGEQRILLGRESGLQVREDRDHPPCHVCDQAVADLAGREWLPAGFD
jgi:hypothetical protein